jgi:hypothetical protein
VRRNTRSSTMMRRSRTLKRATELDPNFAMALATLGVAYNNTSTSRKLLSICKGV